MSSTAPAATEEKKSSSAKHAPHAHKDKDEKPVVKVNAHLGKPFTLDYDANQTVGELKKLVAQHIGVGTDKFRVVFHSHELKEDDKKVSDVKIVKVLPLFRGLVSMRRLLYTYIGVCS